MGNQKLNEDLRGLVDLETPDSELEDLMLKEYRGKLFENQHQVINSKDGNRSYKFLHLNIVYALDFLEKFGENFSYVLIKTSDKKVLMQREVARLEICLN